MSFGTRRGWAPQAYPADHSASRRLQEWLREGEGSLDAVGLDFRGVDLTGGDFSESWFSGAVLTGVVLRKTDFYRADMQGCDLSGADLTGSSFVRSNLDDAVMKAAILDGADFVKASLCGVDASAASFRGAQLMGASLLDVNLCGADLTGAKVTENSFRVRLDESTTLQGFSGSLFGPIEILTGEGVREIGGADLEQWIREKGGAVTVIRQGERNNRYKLAIRSCSGLLEASSADQNAGE
ncbi:pentapeptide repeat-containing protein [Streptomyces somaliensis DSM 40738]|uniref:Pentapeptide repeat-containing protein n=1 Tax=Streptomyces somaliensis (strain ATCC 33201 / DSM 40738 / JCM 12659 / KCTC 9044 / NCTC 11332 / NRRL B-12077 / IP 733) TaxID=1134445 RepID=A0AA44IEZ6_STRE0|nr:pentapeptide repeat-containing protein [Streptomyces somaliensis DSM 40738]